MQAYHHKTLVLPALQPALSKTYVSVLTRWLPPPNALVYRRGTSASWHRRVRIPTRQRRVARAARAFVSG